MSVRVEKLRQYTSWPPCENGCSQPLGRKPARRRLWLIGRPTYLCAPCAEAMLEAYESATDEALWRETQAVA